jgi:3-oxoacyl-[acyl-carrier protein] reductase
MIALMKSVAKEFGAEGINANAIAPGTIDTPMRDSFGDVIKHRFDESVPMKRPGTAGELADTVLFLASDCATYINGATLHVNGGSLLV